MSATIVIFLDTYSLMSESGQTAKSVLKRFISASWVSPDIRMMCRGDNPHDPEMGRAPAAGLVVGVLTGAGRREDLVARADHVIASIVELEALLG